jgi:hypothetical protein
MAVLPKNLNVLTQRLANFNRQTIRVRAMSNDQVSPGQTIVFRFPSNTIVDLHNLQIKSTLNSQFSCTLAAGTVSTGGPGTNHAGGSSTTGTAGVASGGTGINTSLTVYSELGMPRYTQALIERLDVTVGGQQITASNTDYGALYTVLRDALADGGGKKPYGDPVNNTEDPEYISNVLHLYNSVSGMASNQGRGLCAQTPMGATNSIGRVAGVYRESAGGNPWDITSIQNIGVTTPVSLSTTAVNHTCTVGGFITLALATTMASPPFIPGQILVTSMAGGTGNLALTTAGSFVCVACTNTNVTIAVTGATVAGAFTGTLTAPTIAASASAIHVSGALGYVSSNMPTFDGQKWSIPSGKSSPYLSKPIVWQGFLGFAGGKFARFIDTAVTGSIELRIRMAPLACTYGAVSQYKGAGYLGAGQVSPALTARAGDYYLSNLYMMLDTISFTDDFYRQMVAGRLIQGGSIVIPFDNYFSVQKQIGQSDTVSFNMATQSLDYLIGVLRRGDYNSNPASVGWFDGDINGEIKMQLGGAPSSLIETPCGTMIGMPVPSGTTGSIRSASYNPAYYSFHSFASNDFQDNQAPTYQWTVCNNMVPTWPADVNDVWALNQSALDVANSISNLGNISTTYEFRRGKFAHITCFNHHAETEKFISGLDTRGASANMAWSVQGIPTLVDTKTGSGMSTFQAMIWGVCTSTIELSAGQNITIIF